MFLSAVHQGLTNWSMEGATTWGHTSPILPRVIAVFSSSVFGVFCLQRENIICNFRKSLDTGFIFITMSYSDFIY